MQIHVSRNAAVIGVFTEHEITEALRNGQLRPSDFAWTNGMTSWKPLSEWELFNRGSAAPAAVNPTRAGQDTADSTLSWERERSFASAARTIADLIVDPRGALDRPRGGFWDMAMLGWVTLLAAAPLYVLFELVNADAYANALRQTGLALMRSTGNAHDAFSGLLHTYARSLATTEPKGFVEAIHGVATTLFTAPLYAAALGSAVFCGLRVFGLFGHQQCRDARWGDALRANLLAFITTWPFAWILIMVPPGTAATAVLVLFTVVFWALNCRINGAALRLSPWLVLGAYVLIWLLLTVMLTAAFILASFALR